MKGKPSRRICEAVARKTKEIFGQSISEQLKDGQKNLNHEFRNVVSGMTDSGKREESVLQEAERLINGDRQAQYSHPTDDYTKTSKAFNALTGHNITPKEAMLFMVCVKLSRECYKAKRDNLVDACGYLGCIEKHEERLAGGK